MARPAPGRLEEIDGERAPWIVRDARRAAPPASADPGTFHAVEAGDVLPAVVHGCGPEGRPSPEARHGHLLRNGAGEGMRARPSSDLISVTEPGAGAVGHVVTMTWRGRPGILCWKETRCHLRPPRGHRYAGGYLPRRGGSTPGRPSALMML